ncbi:hypothetical protein B0G81_2190 [Paraburkholderia sp. BL6665CI2N2]|nr:hypothetical protein B0G81_2190 [Paraburkholderia sp. BL6665CI2N2]
MNTVHFISSGPKVSLQDNRSSKLEIDDLCMVLFDRWCERRSILPLAYLMHSWPMPTKAFQVIQRLSGTLKELELFHADTLTAEERRLLGDLVDLITLTLRRTLEQNPALYSSGGRPIDSA